MTNIEKMLQSDNESATLVLVNVRDLAEFAESLLDKAIEQAKVMNQKEDKGEKRLTSREVRETYRVSLPTLWRWSKAGLLHPQKIGKKNLYLQSELENAIGL